MPLRFKTCPRDPVFPVISGLTSLGLSARSIRSGDECALGRVLEEDRSIRFNVILALEEMARRFAELTVDREMIESAIISDVMLYSQGS